MSCGGERSRVPLLVRAVEAETDVVVDLKWQVHFHVEACSATAPQRVAICLRNAREGREGRIALVDDTPSGTPAPVFAWRSEPGRALYAPGGGAFASAAGLYSYFATADAIFVHAV